MSRFSVTFDDKTVDRLDDWAERLGSSRATAIETAVNWWLAMADESLHHNVVQKVVQPDDAPVTHVVSAPSLPARTPHRGLKPTDTDEIRALIEAVNAIPDASEATGELQALHAKRKADLQREIASLRSAQAPKTEPPPAHGP